MSYRRPGSRRSIIALLASIILLFTSVVLFSASADTTDLNLKKPEWIRALPAMSCPGGHTNCHQSSPVVVDLTGNGKLDIVVATNNGHLLAYTHNGSLLWNTDIGPAFGLGAGKQQIASSPAVADIDKDGQMEVVVGTGTTDGSVCTKGGVIVLDHNGKVQRGFPFITQDVNVAPKGCPDSVYATPALGDLDNNGDLEIVFGAFDKRIYALHHDGKIVAGFPPNSNHYARFGWANLKGYLADEVWSSPALADLNGDGYLDIVTGTEEGNFDSSWAPAINSWKCPYRGPWTAGYCGGSIYALDRSGKLLEGFPRYKNEDIQSTPAIADIDGNGKYEIFVGTGSWNYMQSPDHPTLGFRLFGMDHKGNDLPGWQGGKVTGGFVAGSPSVGDITGDGKPNIVAAASDKRLYAWHTNGQLVAGFPMTPRTYRGTVLDGYNVGTGFILADYSGDGKMEIFLRHAWEIVIINGKGQQLTATSLSDSSPIYLTKGTIWNNPALGDLDGDGHLEMVVQNSELTVWDLPSSTLQAQWPMFKKNAARTSSLEASVGAAPQEYLLVAAQNQEKKYDLQLTLSAVLGKFNWRVSSDNPGRISFPMQSGIVSDQNTILVKISVPVGLPLGMNHLGNIIVTFTQDNGSNQTVTIPVKVDVLRKLHQISLPMVQ